MHFIDTNIFLELIFGQGRMAECKQLIAKIMTGEIESVTSNFNIDSIMIAIEHKINKPEIMETVLTALLAYSGLSIYPIGNIDRLKAIQNMKIYGLDFDDSMTLQAAISSGCEKIVSFDGHFDRLPVKRVEPKDLL